MRQLSVFILWALSVLPPIAAFGSEIQGKISNAQGAALSGAAVLVTSESPASSAKATTAPDGSYTVPGLQPGEYTVTVSAASAAAPLRRRVLIRESSEAVRADFQFPQVAEPATAAEEREPSSPCRPVLPVADRERSPGRLRREE